MHLDEGVRCKCRSRFSSKKNACFHFKFNAVISALHRAAASGGARSRFDVENLKEGGKRDNPSAFPPKPTGAVIVLLTRDEGALVDALDHAGYTALHVAAAAADADAAAALCAAGARFDFRAVNDGDESEKGDSADISFVNARQLNYFFNGV